MIERLDTVDMMVNMGPQHPSTHGVFRMVLTVDGERVVAAEPVIGYLHRGVEKLCENLTYRQIVPLFDRMDYLADYNNELGLALALEKLMGIQPPRRAEFIRTILCELTRINSHMMFYGSFGGDAGVTTPFIYAFRLREEVQQVLESVSGVRMMPNYIRVGGLKDDVPEDFRDRVARLLPRLREGIEECDSLLTRNEVLLARTRGLARISAAEAIAYGLSGPNLRACGLAEDVRRTEPYSIYSELDFDVPLGQNGDAWDRYCIRLEEMRQSARMVEQCLEKMPEGPVMAEMPKALRPPPGEVYVRAENPRGDFGVYLVSQGGDKPYRLKVRAPSFCNLMALERLLVGCYIADCVMVLGSLDIVLGEVDR
ncbi:MAG: NADH-quinone oxidoreductase subunit D [Chloroflexi bacterium]|nr:NADH-quinone oxidoreductase subunit D [Chloroflexota bacterium]